jgi:hypothetical protein
MIRLKGGSHAAASELRSGPVVQGNVVTRDASGNSEDIISNRVFLKPD